MSDKVALSGEFPDFPLEQLLQTIGISDKTGQIKFYDDANTAFVHFKDGKIINAHVDGRDGEEALWALLRWESGKFAVFFGELEDELKINLDLPELLTVSANYVAKKIFKMQQKRIDQFYVPRYWFFIMFIIKLIPERIFKKIDI